MRTADAWCHNVNTNKHKQHCLVVSSLPPGYVALLVESTRDRHRTHSLMFSYLFGWFGSRNFYYWKAPSLRHPSIIQPELRAFPRSAISFKDCLTHACNLPHSAIAGCLNHTLLLHSSTVTYILYTPRLFLIFCHAFTLFLTRTHALCLILTHWIYSYYLTAS